MPTVGKFGKLPVDNSRKSLTLATLLAAAPAAPDSADYVSKVTTWPMYLNDTIGCCAVAAPGHVIEGDTVYGQGAVTMITDANVLSAYEAISGYDPSKTDAQGNNPTDTGCVLQDVFNYWRTTGIGGDKILFFAKVDVKNPAEVDQAIYYFGHIIYGFDVPQSAVNQFNAGQPWSVVADDGGIEGGHAVNVGAYTGSNYTAVTWGATQGVDQAFWAKYADEAWVIGTADWVSKVTAQTPTGLDLNGLGTEFATLTGEPNPFPSPTPTPVPPTPTPTPPPTPVPPVPVPPVPTPPVDVDPDDDALAPVLEHLYNHRWAHLKDVSAAVIEEWLVAKGFWDAA